MRTLDVGVILPGTKKAVMGAPLSETEIPIITSKPPKILEMLTHNDGSVELFNPSDKSVWYILFAVHDNYVDIMKDAASKFAVTAFNMWNSLQQRK